MTEQKPLSEIGKELYEVLAPNPPFYEFIAHVRQYTALEDWMNSCPNEAMFIEACHVAIGHEPTLPKIIMELRARNEHVEIVLDKRDVIELMVQMPGGGIDCVYFDLEKKFDLQDEQFKRKLHALLCNNQEQ